VTRCDRHGARGFYPMVGGGVGRVRGNLRRPELSTSFERRCCTGADRRRRRSGGRRGTLEGCGQVGAILIPPKIFLREVSLWIGPHGGSAYSRRNRASGASGRVGTDR
jgi:hypothetical protein